MIISNKEYRVAILIPALNEEETISLVIERVRKNLPDQDIYVYDNGSSDKTFELAKNGRR